MGVHMPEWSYPQVGGSCSSLVAADVAASRGPDYGLGVHRAQTRSRYPPQVIAHGLQLCAPILPLAAIGPILEKGQGFLGAR